MNNNSVVRVYKRNEFDYKDNNNNKNTEFQTSPNLNLIEEERTKKKEEYNDLSYEVLLYDLKEFVYKHEDKIKFIKYYITEFIYPKIDSIYNFFKQLKNKNSTNENNDYSFKFLIENMKSKSEDINKVFEIFDYIKIKLDSIDYNLFIKQFILLLSTIGDKVDLWKFINNIYMVKIYYNIENNARSENFSILNENNNLCKEMLINIINDDFFDGIYFLGLYDYIYFEERFIFEEKRKDEKKE